jgi:hypothetical protein
MAEIGSITDSRLFGDPAISKTGAKSTAAVAAHCNIRK